MKKSYSQAYAQSGVDIEAGYQAVELMKEDIKRTKTSGVLSDIGGFGGLFQPNMKGYEEPVFVSGTDGVGTKIVLAQKLDKHDTIGQDCVAMCVNDIICAGAKPLFFLDYIAIGKNNPEKVASIVKGVADGCVLSKCALIGGETAEHPGVMKEDDYDLAGFAVGVVDKKKIITPDKVNVGDVIIALASSGIHSNGFSLVRKVYDMEHQDVDPEVLEKLLVPTTIYVEPILKLLEEVDVHGISHITGGGFYENMPRCLKENQTAKIDKSLVKTPQLFKEIQEKGNINEHDMFNTFNMGVGMIVVVDKEDVDNTLRILNEYVDSYVIGEVVEGQQGVLL